jgi:O-phosphoseryl-tRNA synthetase
VKWNSKEIVKKAKADFEGTWRETGKLIPGQKVKKKPGKGRANLVFETLQKLRVAYLKLGFEEVVNPLYIEDKEIMRQFGPEGYAVLDRCYYLGGLPRPDIGLSMEKISSLKDMGIVVKDKDTLQEILHRYKKGEFGGDDLVYKIAKSMEISDSLASKAVGRVFSEFKALKPEASNITLRSHMTSGWFLTLEKLVDKKPSPIRLFSVDRCFRREQEEDRTHLRSHHSASCVLLDEDVSTEDGKEIARALLREFGFNDFKFKLDEKRSKYYAPGTQTEVYGRSPGQRWIELATFGIYSPIALSRYKIEYPVMNLGLGVERLTMVLHGFRDLRQLIYPQFYGEWHMRDAELASLLRVNKKPLTGAGRDVARGIIKLAIKRGEEKSPCKFMAYTGELLGSKVAVKIVEKEKGTKLLGPAALNRIYVHEASIYGLSPKTSGKVTKDGVDTGLTYLTGIANLAAQKIEASVKKGEKKISIKFRTAKTLGDINLILDKVAQRYITANSKKIDIRGPVFLTIEAYVK